MVGASWGSSCKFNRAFVDPSSGHTTCVWSAPSQDELTALFAKVGVEVESVTAVEEKTTVEG